MPANVGGRGASASLRSLDGGRDMAIARKGSAACWSPLRAGLRHNSSDRAQHVEQRQSLSTVTIVVVLRGRRISV